MPTNGPPGNNNNNGGGGGMSDGGIPYDQYAAASVANQQQQAGAGAVTGGDYLPSTPYSNVPSAPQIPGDMYRPLGAGVQNMYGDVGDAEKIQYSAL